MDTGNNKPLRIYWLAGPSDFANDYKTWKNQSGNATSFGGGVFVEQFYHFCHEMNADAHILSTTSGENFCAERVAVEYRPDADPGVAGWRYHLRLVGFMFAVIISIFRFQPDVVLLNVADRFWFLLYIFYFSKIKMVPFYHMCHWARLQSFNELTLVQRLQLRLTGHFLRHRCPAALTISDAITPQLDQITAAHSPKIVRFVPVYDRALFKDIHPPNWHNTPFRVLFVGRVSTDKGVYDLLETARVLRKRNRDNIIFDICGTGDEIENVRKLIKREGIKDVNLHGQCDRKTLQELYSQCHVVIIPTSRDFAEGFNRVSIEAVLCGRPVIISSAAIETDTARAAIEVTPGDIEGYANAVAHLQDDGNFYQTLCSAAVDLQHLFYDRKRGWEHGLRAILGNANKNI
jgi:glycogen synthase